VIGWKQRTLYLGIKVPFRMYLSFHTFSCIWSEAFGRQEQYTWTKAILGLPHPTDGVTFSNHIIAHSWQITVRLVQHVWNVMAHAQKPDLVFPRNGRSPFKSAAGRQFSRLLEAEVSASAIVMLDTPCSEIVWRVLATHSTHMFPLHFPYRASPCAITFQLSSTVRWSVIPQYYWLSTNNI